MDVTVRPLQTNSWRDRRRWLRLPMSLYAGDSNFVPPLIADEKRRFFSDENPIFNFTDVCYFLAERDNGEPVGRVSAHINHNHNEYHNERTGFFGFFESVKDLNVARALLEHAERWHGERDMDTVRGPFNFSTNEESGLLVEGFDSPPAIMMDYSKPFYDTFLRQCGYGKAKDLLALDYRYPGQIPSHIRRFAKRAQKKMDLEVRRVQMENLEEDVRTVLGIYSDAWRDNWGFIPMTEDELAHMAQELRPVIEPDLALIAQKDGNPVGFCLALPDYNELLRYCRGRLIPDALFYFLFGRKLIHRVRVLLFGVRPEYRRRGVDILLLYHLFSNGVAQGYFSAELSWILEDNEMMLRGLRRMGAARYKTYRIYEKEL